MKKIFRAVIRDLYFHKSRTLISFLTIFLVIALPIGMFSTAPSISESLERNFEEYHLSHLDLRVSGATDAILPIINHTIINEIGVSPKYIATRLIYRTRMTQEEKWYPVNTVGINNSREWQINQIQISAGSCKGIQDWELDEDEAFLLDSYAAHLNLSVGDRISLYGKNKVLKFSIIGLVKSIEFLSFSLTQEGAIYLNETAMRTLLDIPAPYITSVLIYFSESISKSDVSSCSEALQQTLESHHVNVILRWQMREISVSAAFRDALTLTSKYLNASALIIMLVAGIVIFVISKRYAFEQRKQTGVLYSYGFSQRSILLSFFLRISIILGAAIALGTIAGYGFLMQLATTLGTRWGILKLYITFSPTVVVEVISGVGIVVFLFTYFAVRENVKMTPYEAIRGKAKEYGTVKHVSNRRPILSLQIRYALRNLARNRTRSILTFLAFSSAIMLCFSLLNARVSVIATKDQYFQESIKWDVKATFTGFNLSTSFYDDVHQLEGITYSEPIFEYYAQPVNRSDLVIVTHATIDESQLVFIDIQQGSGLSSFDEDDCVLSIYEAERLNVHIGDKVSFWILNRMVNVTIVGFYRDLEMPASMYMDLADLEKLFGFNPQNGLIATTTKNVLNNLTRTLNTYTNVNLALPVETYQSRITNMINTQTVIVNIMVILGLVVSFLTMFSTAFISAIEREREIALERIFGFSSFQLIWQLFVELLLLTLAALISGYILGDFLCRYWISIISAIFFKVDLFHFLREYLQIFAFALLTAICSIYPGFRLLMHQKLAEIIKDE